MVDAPALGAGGGNPVEVQVLSPVPFLYRNQIAQLLHGFIADALYLG